MPRRLCQRTRLCSGEFSICGLYKADSASGSTYDSGVTTFFAKLDDRGTLSLSGQDARKFLQGQVTCDLDTLSEAVSLAGACCTPQGRVVFDFRLLQRSAQDLLLLLPGQITEIALATLGKYIVFSRAEVTDAASDWVQFAIWGPEAATKTGATSRTPGASWQEGDVTWIVVDASGAVEACVPAGQAEAFTRRWAGELGSGNAADYRRHEITHGIGHVLPSTSEMFLPQMLNYQLTGRVSFTKGCYTGQEVVARMHYKGKVKRAMLAARVEGAAEPGDALYGGTGTQSVGNIVSAEKENGDNSLVLAVVALDAVEQGVRLGETGPSLVFADLPYSLDGEAPA